MLLWILLFCTVQLPISQDLASACSFIFHLECSVSNSLKYNLWFNKILQTPAICIFGPLNKHISQAIYLFSYQYLTGVISLIVINQKKKIKSVHQDHGCSNCFRSKVHWNRYTVLYILVYILSLIYQVIPLCWHRYFIPTFLCKYIVLVEFLLPPPPPKKNVVSEPWFIWNKATIPLGFTVATNTVRISNNSLITNYRKSFL